MTSEPQKLMNTVAAMRDEDLLKMVYVDCDQYRPEALTYAKAEIRQRGIAFDRTDINVGGASMPTLPLAAFGRSLWRNRRVLAFALGFAGCLIWFAWLNFDSYRNMYKADCFDCFVFFGFPFYLYQTGGFAGPTRFLWVGLTADLAIATIASAAIGWLLMLLTSRLTSRADVG